MRARSLLAVLIASAVIAATAVPCAAGSSPPLSQITHAREKTVASVRVRQYSTEREVFATAYNYPPVMLCDPASGNCAAVNSSGQLSTTGGGGGGSTVFPYSLITQGQTATAQSGVGVLGVYNLTAPTLTTGQAAPLQLDANGNLLVYVKNPPASTIAVTQSTSPWVVSGTVTVNTPAPYVAPTCSAAPNAPCVQVTGPVAVTGAFPTPLAVQPISGAPTPIPTPAGGVYPVSIGTTIPVVVVSQAPVAVSSLPPVTISGTVPISGAPTPYPTNADGGAPVHVANTPAPYATNASSQLVVAQASSAPTASGGAPLVVPANAAGSPYNQASPFPVANEPIDATYSAAGPVTVTTQGAFWELTGAAGHVIRIRSCNVSGISGTSTAFFATFTARVLSTTDSGGTTGTAPTVGTFDNTNSATALTAQTYTSGPTQGTAQAIVWQQEGIMLSSTVGTTIPFSTLMQWGILENAEPPTLRSASNQFIISIGGSFTSAAIYTSCKFTDTPT